MSISTVGLAGHIVFLFKRFYLLSAYGCFACICICTSCVVPMEAGRRHQIPWTELQMVLASCQARDSNLCPLKEQQVLLTSKPSLQPQAIQVLYQFFSFVLQAVCKWISMTLPVKLVPQKFHLEFYRSYSVTDSLSSVPALCPYESHADLIQPSAAVMSLSWRSSTQ